MIWTLVRARLFKQPTGNFSRRLRSLEEGLSAEARADLEREVALAVKEAEALEIRNVVEESLQDGSFSLTVLHPAP